MKTVFNDLECKIKYFYYECPDCRVEVAMKIIPYPHGPKEPRFCTVCNTKLDKTSINTLTEIINELTLTTKQGKN